VPQDIRITDLQKVAVLGAGAFGQVMLVKHEGKYLALKTLSKQQIMDMGLHVRPFGTPSTSPTTHLLSVRRMLSLDMPC
jgi:hypothetical protein